jgi:signal peptidase I
MMKTFIRDILLVVVLAAIFTLGLRFTVQKYVIWETCMEPNYYSGQQVLVNKLVYDLRAPQRGEVIIFHPPAPYPAEATPYIKRIIALPGDTVQIKDGEVFVNGVKLNEPYIDAPPEYSVGLHTVDGYFVLGDNRNVANDSHTGYLVPRQNIIGKVWVTIWPLSRFGLAVSPTQTFAGVTK